MSNCKHGVDRDLECGACEDGYEATRAHKAAMALVLDRRAMQHTLVNKTRARMKIKVSEPLTDSEIQQIAIATKSAEPGRDGYVLPYSFARAIEQAHNIKGKPK